MTKVEDHINDYAVKRAKQLCSRMGVKYSEITDRDGIKQDAKKVICMVMKADGFYLRNIAAALSMPMGNVSRAINAGNGMMKYSLLFQELYKLANYGSKKVYRDRK